MVKITEPAALQVKEIQKAQNRENAFLRIHLLNERCSGIDFGMTFEELITEDDMLYEEYGVSIIADIGLAAVLEGITIDYADSDKGSGFRLLRENISPCGGCGSSCGKCEGSC